MDEDVEMDVIADKFDDCDIDDAPLDIASEAGSYFDEEELRSQIDDDVLRSSQDLNSRGRYLPRNRPPITMPTINNVMDEYERNLFDDKNRADLLFPTEMCKLQNLPVHEKENSWEPSFVEYEKYPTPEFDKSPLTRRILKNSDSHNKAKGTSPESNSIFAQSPLSGIVSDEVAKTSTPKRTDVSRFGKPRIPNLNVSSISSIHPGSPVRAVNPVQTPPCNETTMSTNVTVSKTMLDNIVNNAETETDLRILLEQARKHRFETRNPQFVRENATINRTNTSTKTAIENSNRILNDVSSNAQALRSSSTSCDLPSRPRADPTRSTNSSYRDVQRGHIRARPDSARSMASENNSRQTSRLENNQLRSCSRASSLSSVASVRTSASISQKPQFLQLSAKRLAFGAVDIGDSLALEIEVENITNRTHQVRCSLDSTTKSFKILDNRLMRLESGQKSRVRVEFSPECIGRYQVLIRFEIVGVNALQSIPIWGFGGICQIAPIVQGDLSLSNSNDFVLQANTFTNLSFVLRNNGRRDGFARIDVFDSMMKPISCTISPARGVILKHHGERKVRIRLTENLPMLNSDHRSASSMSSYSNRRSLSGADLLIMIRWGEEVLRHRLKLLEKKTGQHIKVDECDFTRTPFDGEQEFNVPGGYPSVHIDDKSLFEAGCRTTNILVYSTRNARKFEQAYHRSASSSLDPNEATVLETTAFRHQTLIRDQDVTLMPRK
ncbi:unnamed protein product [Caenorhabditis bovis]|uniref:Cep192/Spd-2-like domain-containing protein n=1 Tax=Caenorhabditis bovis TaxID=2654633 RepID=A0A8S1FAK3_9PELO|nr:unnamed protein product [Caenorhabditis bovis]